MSFDTETESAMPEKIPNIPNKYQSAGADTLTLTILFRLRNRADTTRYEV